MAECLWYAARLRLPRDVTEATLGAEVDRVLQELDIDHIRDSRIGDTVRRGISGGQRKRVNLGQELLTRTTRLLFLDEEPAAVWAERYRSGAAYRKSVRTREHLLDLDGVKVDPGGPNTFRQRSAVRQLVTLTGRAFRTKLTGWVGMALGLWIGAHLSSTVAAVGTLPLVLIPQITFSGLIVKVKEMGLMAEVLSQLMVGRYALQALLKCGERLTEPLFGGQPERTARPLSGVLYDLGFKPTAAADDQGIPFAWLVWILVTVLVVLLAAATWRTARTRDGD